MPSEENFLSQIPIIRIFPQLINLIKNSSKRFLCSYLSKVINNILHICS